MGIATIDNNKRRLIDFSDEKIRALYNEYAQKTPSQLLCVAGDYGIVNLCGILSQKWDSYHPIWSSYQPVLIFNKIQQAEAKHDRLVQKKRVIYDLVKARGDFLRAIMVNSINGFIACSTKIAPISAVSNTTLTEKVLSGYSNWCIAPRKCFGYKVC
jgi:hypothetical protein